MANLDDLARAAEEAEAANIHDRPVTDADLGETATEGAQVVVDSAGQTAVPAMPPAQPLPEMQLPQPVQPVAEQMPPAPTPMPVVTVQTPISAAAPAPLPEADKAPRLTPFNDQITTDTAPAAPVMQIAHPDVAAPAQPVQTPVQQPMQPAQPMAEQPSAPPAPGTMPGQTVSPQINTPPSHIITESYPHPTTGADPLSGIAV